jgi:hypothetical protein
MLIGISGAAGSGKSTAAEHLVEVWGFHRRRFAGPLKAMMKAFGLTDAQVDGDEKAIALDILGGKTPRQAMQTLGTEWGRVLVAPDLWLRAWRATLPSGVDVVVDDVRFPNEAEEIEARGGVLVHIARKAVEPEPLSWFARVILRKRRHVSEGYIPERAIVIQNESDIAGLLQALDGVMEDRMTRPKLAA